ncbi:MAG: hypothetical protein BWK78_04520 [Thiotrichaceae bacterium IS1]|nr:MAG: hypothetical protein BWK78_04520 [Thiotrichaceae bacterium IS1]
MNELTSVWNSLEIAKLTVDIVTTLLLGAIFWLIDNAVRRAESARWRNQKLVEKRLNVYDDTAPQLNDLLCYYTYVGNWQGFTPVDIIHLKRELDKKIHVAAPLFSKEFLEKYSKLMVLCFETFVGVGKDARLRTKTERRIAGTPGGWKEEYNERFSAIEDCPPREEIKAAYNELMACFAAELEIGKPIATN